MRDIDYDDSNLQRMFNELQPKVRLRALRGAFRRAATKVRKVAVNNLRSSLNSSRELERGIRALVWKKNKAGFRVTVGTKRDRKGREKGFYISRHATRWAERRHAALTGKPVLIWAEDGTDCRRTKGGWLSRRKRRYTGQMKRYGFMAKTKLQVSSSITNDLRKEIVKNIERTAKKYGCT